MASKGSIAALQDTSLKRLMTAIKQASEKYRVDPVAIPTHDRDPNLLMAYQLEAMANWAERLAAVDADTPKADAQGMDDQGMDVLTPLTDEQAAALAEALAAADTEPIEESESGEGDKSGEEADLVEETSPGVFELKKRPDAETFLVPETRIQLLPDTPVGDDHAEDGPNAETSKKTPRKGR